MKRTIYLVVIAAIISVGQTGCNKRYKTRSAKHIAKPVQQVEVKMIPQKINYDFSYPAEKEAMLPTLELDNMTKRAGDIVLSNSGDIDLKLVNINVSKKDKNLFKISNNCPTTLRKSEECNIKVRFVGDKSGVFSTNVVVTSNDALRKKIVFKVDVNAIEKITLNTFTISDNVKDYLEDKANTKKEYYLRVVFQTKIDKAFQKQIKAAMNMVLKENNYKKVSPYNASKVITLYPSIVMTDKQNDQYDFQIAMNGSISTKADAKSAGAYHDTNVTSYDYIKENKKMFDKEKFAFYMDIATVDQKDKNAMYKDISNIVATKTVNILGLEK